MRLLILRRQSLLLRLLDVSITSVRKSKVGVCDRPDRQCRRNARRLPRYPDTQWILEFATVHLGVWLADRQGLGSIVPGRFAGCRLGIDVLRVGSAGADIDVRRSVRRVGERLLFSPARFN